MRPEARLYKWVREHLPNCWHVIRIENICEKGTPDLHLTTPMGSCWVECKVDEPILRPEQFAWSMRELRAGGNVLVLVRRNEDWGLWNLRNVTVKFMSHGCKITTEPMTTCQLGLRNTNLQDAILQCLTNPISTLPRTQEHYRSPA